MSSPITLIQQLRCANGNFSDAITGPSTVDSQTNGDGRRVGVLVPTTAAGTAVDFTNLTAPGWAMFVNMDPTNYVEVGLQVGGTFYALGQMNPGKACGPIYVAGSVAVYWRAHTAACRCDALVLDR